MHPVGYCLSSGPAATLMDYIVAAPELLGLCAPSPTKLVTLPDPRGVHHALPVLPATLLAALAGGANRPIMAAVATSRTTTGPGSGCGCP